MKNKIIVLVILIINISCSKDKENIVIENKNPHNLINLGLAEQENIYPFWPDTWNAGLGDNRWDDYKRGDTLFVYRRDAITDDSGDYLYYTFLIKQNKWIEALKIKRVSNDAHIEPPRFGQIMFDKPILNFRLQKYEENKVLACEIETQNGDYFLYYPLVDRMWIKLDD